MLYETHTHIYNERNKHMLIAQDWVKFCGRQAPGAGVLKDRDFL